MTESVLTVELNEKLQKLRKQRGLTQEELAKQLYVSRTAVSKWESGRGTPGIESLKAISAFFGVPVDDLLSGEALTIMDETDCGRRKAYMQDMIFGGMDCGMALLLVLPLFAQRVNGAVQAVSLLGLTAVHPGTKAAYAAAVVAMTVTGVLTLALQNSACALWAENKARLSSLLGIAGLLLLIAGRQPYAAAFVCFALAIKVLILLKRR